MESSGSCRCGHLRYRFEGPFGPVANCHCAFCRRVHGAAFTTVAFVDPDRFTWLSPVQNASIYTTPQGAVRHFCGQCASPIFNYSPILKLGAVLTNSLDSPQPAPWVHVNVESKLPWLLISDGLPSFRRGPRRSRFGGSSSLILVHGFHGASWSLPPNDRLQGSCGAAR